MTGGADGNDFSYTKKFSRVDEEEDVQEQDSAEYVDDDSVCSTTSANTFSDVGYPICLVCAKEFPFSHLFDQFNYHLCDSCRS